MRGSSLIVIVFDLSLYGLYFHILDGKDRAVTAAEAHLGLGAGFVFPRGRIVVDRVKCFGKQVGVIAGGLRLVRGPPGKPQRRGKQRQKQHKQHEGHQHFHDGFAAAVTEGVFQSLHSATSLLIIAVDACKNARTIRIHAVAQV